MEVWKIMFLSKWVICRFHVNLPGCRLGLSYQQMPGKWRCVDSVFNMVGFVADSHRENLRDFAARVRK